MGAVQCGVLWGDKGPRVFQSCVSGSAGRTYGVPHSEEVFQKLLGLPNCILIGLFSLFQSPQEALGSPRALVGLLCRKGQADWLLDVSGPEATPLDLWIFIRSWGWGRGQAAFPEHSCLAKLPVEGQKAKGTGFSLRLSSSLSTVAMEE